MIGPQTLATWLRGLRRRGVQCRLHGGRVRVSGVRGLSALERAALFESGPQVQALLERRAQRKRKKDEKQQHGMATAEPQRPRKVIGHVVLGGGRTRPLFEDECRPIPAHTRVLGKIPYGWLIGGE